MTQENKPSLNSSDDQTTKSVSESLGTLKGVSVPALAMLGPIVSGDDTDNTINGGAGDDLIEGRGANDLLSGGAGDDLIAGEVLVATSSGPVNAFHLNSAAAGAMEGNDSILGGSGADTLAGETLSFTADGTSEARSTNTATNAIAGNDTIGGGPGDDAIAGDALAIGTFSAEVTVENSAFGNTAEAGNDSLSGVDGSDSIAGDAFALSFGFTEAIAGHTAVEGASGNDTLSGDGAADTLSGDSLAISDGGVAVAFMFSDARDGGSAGSDIIAGNGGMGLIAGDALASGNSSSSATANHTALAGSHAGNDSITAGSNNDTISGDVLVQHGGTATANSDAALAGQASAGSDTIDSGNGNDLIAGDALAQNGGTAISTTTADSLRAGADLIYAGDGNDKIAGDSLSLGGLADVTYGGSDTIFGGAGADLISGDALAVDLGSSSTVNGGGDDLLYGGDGDDTIYGDGNGSVTDGGDDSLFGGAGNDLLYGNDGDDLISGDGSSLVTSVGDVVVNNFSVAGSVGADVIHAGDGNDLVAGDALNAGDFIASVSVFNTATAGTSSGNDSIVAGLGNDTIAGDALVSGVGTASVSNFATVAAMTFAGNDTIDGGNGDDLISGDALSLALSWGSATVENIGTAQSVGADVIYAGVGNDSIAGDALAVGGLANAVIGGADIIFGGAGNDLIAGDALATGLGSIAMVNTGGDDLLYGGDGDDTIYGDGNGSVTNGGDDSLFGGAGNDLLYGNSGDDVISGDGSSLVTSVGDVVVNNFSVAGSVGTDVIHAGDGNDLVAGDALDPGDFTSSASVFNTATAGTSAGNDSILAGLGNDTVAGDALVRGSGTASVSNFATVAAMTFAGNDTIDGGNGDDLISGDALSLAFSGGFATVENIGAAQSVGADVIYAGQGNDSIGGDALTLGGQASVVSGGNDTIFGGGGADLISGDALAINPGSSSTVNGGGDDLLYGGDGDDTIYGDGNDAVTNGGDDSLYGGAGNDLLYGNSGDDLISGDGSALIGSAGEVTISNIGVAGSVGADVIYAGDGDDLVAGDGLDSGVFTASASVFNTASAGASAGNDSIIAGHGNDTVAGDVLVRGDGAAIVTNTAALAAMTFAGNDSIDGGQGDDLIAGDALALGLSAGSANVENIGTAQSVGADVIYAGDGNDSIAGDALAVGGQASVTNGGDDTVFGGDGADLISGDALAVNPGSSSSVNGGGDDLLYGGDGNDTIYGDGNGAVTNGGDDSLFGGAGNDLLYGNSGDDTLEGGSGDDVLYGGDGTDVARFSGTATDYQIIALEDGGVTVTDLRVGSPDGTDTLYDIESLAFSNITILPPLPPAVSGDHLLRVLADGSAAGDLDTATLAVSLVSDVSNGALTLNADGTYSYTPAIGFTGIDSFTYLDDGVERTVRIEVGLSGTGSGAQVNNTTDINETEGDVGALVGGGYVVTWVVNNDSGQGVYAQRFDADGNEAGAEIFIPKPGGFTVHPYHPSVAGLANGGFVVTWGHGATSSREIRAQSFDAEGNAVGPEATLDSVSVNDRQPEVVGLPSGGYAVAWGVKSSGSVGEIRVRSFDDVGTPVSGNVVLTTHGYLDSYDIMVQADGGYLVAWIDSTGSHDLLAQRFNGLGTPVGSEITLYAPAGGASISSTSKLSLTLLESGNFAASWSANGPDGDGEGIMVRLFQSDGTPLGTAFVVNDDSAGNQTDPSISTLPGGGFVVAWTSDVGDGDGYGIFARQFDAAGSPVGGQFMVSDTATGDQTNVEVITLADGRLAFSWSQPDGGDNEVFTRILSLGTDNHDHLQGDGQDDVLRGFGGNDILTGNGGNDTLIGGAGNDTLNGGLGENTAVFSGNFADYQITDLGGGSYEVADLRIGSPDGTDLLFDVENLLFADQLVDLTAPPPPPPAVSGDHLLRVLADGSAAGDLDTVTLAVSLVSDVSNGALTLNADGTYSYTPAMGFTGIDSFTYLDDGVERTVRIEVGLSGTRSGAQVNNTTDINETEGDVGALVGGGYVVTWVVNNDSGQGVYAQRFDADGNEAGAEIFIPKPGGFTVHPYHPSVAGLANGGFVVTWGHGATSSREIRAQSFDAEGNAVGPEATLDSVSVNDRQPEVVGLPSGGYAVAWGVKSSGSVGEIRVRSFDDVGTPVSGDVVLTTHGHLDSYDIMVQADGGYLVAWIDSTGSHDLLAQRFNGLGTPMGSEITLYAPAGGTSISSTSKLSLTLLESGNFAASWSANGPDGDGEGIMVRLFQSDGTPLGTAFVVNDDSAGNQTDPSISTLPGGGFVVAWTSDVGDGDGYGIFARQFDAAGNPIGGQFMVSDTATGDQTNVEVITLADGRLAFSWSQPDGGDNEVFTRILSLGTDNHDHLQGDGQDDVLRGFGGNDILTGNGGNDTLIGGAGNDTLNGGAGNDVFVYNDILDAGDLIDGFDATGADQVDLDGLLDGLGVADVDRSARVDVQQAGTGQDAVISVDTNGDTVFDTVVATVTNVTGDLDQNDLNLGTLV